MGVDHLVSVPEGVDVALEGAELGAGVLPEARADVGDQGMGDQDEEGLAVQLLVVLQVEVG